MQTHPFRGPLFMVLATGSYVANDTLMKLVMEALPPYQVLLLRGAAATLWGLPLLLALGYGRKLPLMFEWRVLQRNLTEAVAVLCFILALANMPIADATALGQVTPLVVLLGASLIFHEKITRLSLALVGLGFAGALLVAQPSGEGISIYAVLALANAVLCAVRDLIGRRIDVEVPGLVVAISAAFIVFLVAGASHVLFEQWTMPEPRHLLLMAGSGFFLMFGHFFLFMAYRVGSTGTVAPFYYSFTIWAVMSGLLVFGYLPGKLALTGMALVVGSGLAIVLLDGRKRRLAPVS